MSSLPSGRPLLKWAGGKRQLLATLRRYYPARFERYIEPFVGSGAVFFDLCAAGRLQSHPVTLADVNADLIGCYRAIRDDPEAVIRALIELEAEHRGRGAECYYDVRDCRFNPARARFTGSAAADAYTPALAAMLIYLNRTGYNGLFRLNRAGAFNVPAGRYVNPRICDADHIRSVARALSTKTVSLEWAPFDVVLAGAGAGDFVYCDPPYAPLSRTSSFAQYTADGFTMQDHERLQRAIVAAAHRGATVLLSNSSAPEIEAAYGASAARNAGLKIDRVPARRAINSRASHRGAVAELIVSNTPATGRLRMARAHLRPGYPDQLPAGRAGKRQA